DPATKTISLLSFPRDLIVPVYCKGGFVTDDRINSAFSRCGSTGTLETVKHLTGLPVNYLIKVNFHGFKEIVDQLGGVWMDVDRRYYNKNVGSAATNFANINLQPGYQQLGGGSALEFVRYRHTDSDLYRLARQQQFVRAFKEQVAKNFDITKLQGIVSSVTHNVEVAACKACLSDTTVLRYALFAATLPNGHFFQDRISGVQGYSELHAPTSSIQDAVNQFVNPDVTVAKEQVVEVPKRQPPYVRFDRGPGDELLQPLVSKLPFRLEVPTVLERSSSPDTLPSDKPVRLYWIDGRGNHKAVRLIFRTGTN